MPDQDHENLPVELKDLNERILRWHRQNAALLKAHKIALQLVYSTFFFNMGEQNSQKWVATMRGKAVKAPSLGREGVKELDSIFLAAQRLARSYGKGPGKRVEGSVKDQKQTGS